MKILVRVLREKEREFINPRARTMNKLDQASANTMVASLFDIMSRDRNFATLVKMMIKKRASSKSSEKDGVQKPDTKRHKVEDLRLALEGNNAFLKKLRFIPNGLTLSSASGGIIKQLLRENTQNLLEKKKLTLILDLDHTLLHSRKTAKLSFDEEYLLTDPDKSLFVWGDFVTKLRPYVHTFLQEASNMFDMYIYTMGTHAYAMQMAEFLDPRGIYFKSKVIAREDSTVPNQKGLDVVLGEERVIVILDDTENVWGRHKESLIVMERYNFFASRHCMYGLGGGSLSELKRDEGEFDGALATTLLVLKRVHQMFFNSSDNDVRKVLLKIRDEA